MAQWVAIIKIFEVYTRKTGFDVYVMAGITVLDERGDLIFTIEVRY